jgi:4-hydroxy-tetrahydrodipicolinate synthase
VVDRLLARYPGNILGIKDSGGDLNFTLELARRFPQLLVLTGTETHVPDVMAAGGRGTICGLGNVMPRLMRRMMDTDDPSTRDTAVALLAGGDEIICRKPFIPSLKTIIAAQRNDAEWRRVVPPMTAVEDVDAQQIVTDFATWEAALPNELRPLSPALAAGEG